MMPTLFDSMEPAETETRGLEGDWWDLNGTIHEYSYLTHNFFRYYGKFPSVLAKKVIAEFLPAGRGANILDNHSGCGTTLVEAMLAGHNSVGTDINPLGVLAASVKTRPLPDQDLARAFDAICDGARAILDDGTIDTGSIALSEAELAKWFPRSGGLGTVRSAAGHLRPGQQCRQRLLPARPGGDHPPPCLRRLMPKCALTSTRPNPSGGP